jgi:hypothetical protein
MAYEFVWIMRRYQEQEDGGCCKSKQRAYNNGDLGCFGNPGMDEEIVDDRRVRGTFTILF